MKAINFLLPLAIFSFLGLIFIFTKSGTSASPKTTTTEQDSTPQEPTSEPKVTIQITKSETSSDNSSASATVEVVTTDNNGSQTVKSSSSANTGGNTQDDDQSQIQTGDASAKSTVKTNSN